MLVISDWIFGPTKEIPYHIITASTWSRNFAENYMGRQENMKELQQEIKLHERESTVSKSTCL